MTDYISKLVLRLSKVDSAAEAADLVGSGVVLEEVIWGIGVPLTQVEIRRGWKGRGSNVEAGDIVVDTWCPEATLVWHPKCRISVRSSWGGRELESISFFRTDVPNSSKLTVYQRVVVVGEYSIPVLAAIEKTHRKNFEPVLATIKSLPR